MLVVKCNGSEAALNTVIHPSDVEGYWIWGTSLQKPNISIFWDVWRSMERDVLPHSVSRIYVPFLV